jgi:hypothetical protein
MNQALDSAIFCEKTATLYWYLNCVSNGDILALLTECLFVTIEEVPSAFGVTAFKFPSDQHFHQNIPRITNLLDESPLQSGLDCYSRTLGGMQGKRRWGQW